MDALKLFFLPSGSTDTSVESAPEHHALSFPKEVIFDLFNRLSLFEAIETRLVSKDWQQAVEANGAYNIYRIAKEYFHSIVPPLIYGVHLPHYMEDNLAVKFDFEQSKYKKIDFIDKCKSVFNFVMPSLGNLFTNFSIDSAKNLISKTDDFVELKENQQISLTLFHMYKHKTQGDGELKDEYEDYLYDIKINSSNELCINDQAALSLFFSLIKCRISYLGQN